MKSFTNHLNEQIEKAKLDAINKYLHIKNKELKSDIEYLLKNMTFTNDEKVMLILDKYT